MSAALFDFGGTLDSNGASWVERFYPAYIKHGIRVPREDFARAFYDSDDRLPLRFALQGLGLTETLTLQVRCVLERLAPERLHLADPIASEFAAAGRARLRESAGVLRRIKDALPLGVVSNFYGNLTGILEREGLLDIFDVVVDSTEVGCLKPDPRIFIRAANVLRLEPSEILMVGDSIPRDMRGAEAAGMPHAWLKGDRPARRCCPKALLLDRLEDVEAVLRISSSPVVRS